MLEIAICDDEPVMRKEISRHFSDYMAKRQDMDYRIRGFESGKQLLAWGHDFDLIFLDIQMEQPDGMETARRLRQRGSQSLLVFVTVLKECVFDAFEVEACDYLLKPLDTGHFERTMERVYERIRQKPAKRLLVQRGNQSQVVLLSESVYCEVQGRKIYIHQKNGEIIDCRGYFPEEDGERPKIMVRIVDVRRMLMSLRLRSLMGVCFCVTDPVVEENNRCVTLTGTEFSGVMLMDGKAENSEGTISVAALASLVFGAKTTEDVCMEDGVVMTERLKSELKKVIPLSGIYLNEAV